jgi:hypothetical protein
MNKTTLGKCSKHRHIREFKLGDKVRLVCLGGRDFKCEFPSLGYVDVVSYVGSLTKPIYPAQSQVHWGGLVGLDMPCGHWHYFSPRALEMLTQ